MMAALDAIRAAGLKTKSNIKFVFEGEEEAGSPNLEKILAANRELFCGRRVAERAMAPYTKRGISRLRSATAASVRSISLFMVRAANYTAAITAIGPPIRP